MVSNCSNVLHLTACNFPGFNGSILITSQYIIVDILEINMLIKVVYNDENWLIVVLISFTVVIVLQVYP